MTRQNYINPSWVINNKIKHVGRLNLYNINSRLGLHIKTHTHNRLHGQAQTSIHTHERINAQTDRHPHAYTHIHTH